jgi:hypothetical protein
MPLRSLRTKRHKLSAARILGLQTFSANSADFLCVLSGENLFTAESAEKHR